VALFALSALLLVFTFRRPRRISVTALLLAMLIGALTPAVFALLIRYRPGPWVLVAMGCLGLATGILWSRSTRIYVAQGQIMARNSVWYLAVWGGLLAITQLVSIVTNRPPGVVMALLIMSTGTVVGMNGSLLLRYGAVKAGRRAPDEVFPGAQATRAGRHCRSCGRPLGPVDVFCVSCGARHDGE
jgi:hypothetical protein